MGGEKPEVKRLLTMLICLLLCLSAFASGEEAAEAGPDICALIGGIVTMYGRYGPEAEPELGIQLEKLDTADPDAAARWKKVLQIWKSIPKTEIHKDVLPDGLPETNAFCIVALGFQLNPDGSMRDELTGRLEVVLHCAEKYPNAYIACTGGPTAMRDSSATEADRMAEWLEEHGVARERLIVENQSMTTAQNAIFTFRILSEHYPEINRLAIVSSDYHIPTGILLFETEAILRAEKAGSEKIHVISNAAYETHSGSPSAAFQASALIALSDSCYSAYDNGQGEYDFQEEN